MPNLWTNMMNSAGDWMAAKIAPYIQDALGMRGAMLANYYSGDHRPQLKTKVGQQDDNIVQNFVGLAVDRSVSRLYRGGVQFVLPDGATTQKEYLDKVWDLNKKEIILYQVGLHGAVYGTAFFKICPDELVDPMTNKIYPRLIAIDPEIIRVECAPQDMNDIERYIIEYKLIRKNDAGRPEEVAFREITRQAADNEQYDTPDGPESLASETWVIEEWEQSAQFGNQWTLVSSTPWPYEFPPIIHWKNLPSLKSCYGSGDIDDAINVQDKSNFVVSNTGKIIKFHAHPETIGTGFSADSIKKLDGAVGAFHIISTPEAKVFNLEMQSDLASSRAFALDLRQSIFDISREVDLTSISDKLGALTNFGLHVLYTDALDKNDTKRQLYGDALKELNRRLLVLAGNDGIQSDPGKIAWGDALITNPLEEMQVDQLALDMRIVDRETVSERYKARYGKSWDDIQKALAQEGRGDNANNANIGATILRNFNQGGGA